MLFMHNQYICNDTGGGGGGGERCDSQTLLGIRLILPPSFCLSGHNNNRIKKRAWWYMPLFHNLVGNTSMEIDTALVTDKPRRWFWHSCVYVGK